MIGSSASAAGRVKGAEDAGVISRPFSSPCLRTAVRTVACVDRTEGGTRPHGHFRTTIGTIVPRAMPTRACARGFRSTRRGARVRLSGPSGRSGLRGGHRAMRRSNRRTSDARCLPGSATTPGRASHRCRICPRRRAGRPRARTSTGFWSRGGVPPSPPDPIRDPCSGDRASVTGAAATAPGNGSRPRTGPDKGRGDCRSTGEARHVLPAIVEGDQGDGRGVMLPVPRLDPSVQPLQSTHEIGLRNRHPVSQMHPVMLVGRSFVHAVQGRHFKRIETLVHPPCVHPLRPESIGPCRDVVHRIATRHGRRTTASIQGRIGQPVAPAARPP